MKHLLLALFFSASLSAFSQVDTIALGPIDLSQWGPVQITADGRIFIGGTAAARDTLNQGTPIKPDTVRAICLVTMGYRQLGIAHARMGFVVIEAGKEVIYLDCNKRALKLPQVGWGWREVDKTKER